MLNDDSLELLRRFAKTEINVVDFAACLNNSGLLINLVAQGVLELQHSKQLNDILDGHVKVNKFIELYRVKAQDLGPLFNGLDATDQWLIPKINGIEPILDNDHNPAVMNQNGAGDRAAISAEQYQNSNSSLRRMGDVPPQVSTNIRRRYVADVIEKLRLLSQRKIEKSLVISGLTGIGKTVVAAQALRDPTVLNDIGDAYFSSVFWISIGDNDNSHTQESDLISHLVNKINVLIGNIELAAQASQAQAIPPHRCTTLGEATSRLKYSLAQYFPKGLLVLDDLNSICNHKAIRCFGNLDYRIMVLSQNKDAIPNQTPSQILSVEIEEGFSIDETLVYLRNCEVDEIEIERNRDTITHIRDFCGGHPFALSVIAKTVRMNKDVTNRWTDVYHLLVNHETVTIEAESKEYRNTSFYQALGVLLQRLAVINAEVCEHFCQFSIFEQNVRVPQQVMMIYWGCGEHGLNKITKILEDHSLMHVSTNGPKPTYYIHSMMYVTLCKHVAIQLEKDNGKKNYHEIFINRYLEQYRNGFSTIDPSQDPFIFRYLPYHLKRTDYKLDDDKVSKHKKIGGNYLELAFIIPKLLACGSEDTASDFSIYGRRISNYATCYQRTMSAKIYFEQFIARNSYLFSVVNLNWLTRSHILQQALLEGSESCVYRQAIQISKESEYRDNFLLMRCNKSGMHNRIQLSANIDSGSCCFLLPLPVECASFIFTVGSDKQAYLLNSNTGEKIEMAYLNDLSQPLLPVTCCSIRFVKPNTDDSNNNSKMVRKSMSKTDDEESMIVVVVRGHYVYWNEYLGKQFRNFFKPNSTGPWALKDSKPALLMLSKRGISIPGVNSPCLPADDDKMPRRSATVSEGMADWVPPLSEMGISPGVSVGSSSSELSRSDDLNASYPFNDIHGKHQINWCQLSHDAKFLATASSDKTVKIWNPSMYTHPITLSGHQDVVTCLSFRSDDKRLVSVDQAQNYIVWSYSRVRTNNWKQFTSFFNEKEGKGFVVRHKKIRQSNAKVVDIEPGLSRCFFIEGSGCFRDHVLSATDKSFFVWLPNNNGNPVKWYQSIGELISVSICAEGRFISCCLGGEHCDRIQVWDVECWETGGKPIYLCGHSAAVCRVAFAIGSSGRLASLVSGDSDGNIMVWSLANLMENVDPIICSQFGVSFSHGQKGAIIVDGITKLIIAKNNRTTNTEPVTCKLEETDHDPSHKIDPYIFEMSPNMKYAYFATEKGCVYRISVPEIDYFNTAIDILPKSITGLDLGVPFISLNEESDMVDSGKNDGGSASCANQLPGTSSDGARRGSSKVLRKLKNKLVNKKKHDVTDGNQFSRSAEKEEGRRSSLKEERKQSVVAYSNKLDKARISTSDQSMTTSPTDKNGIKEPELVDEVEVVTVQDVEISCMAISHDSDYIAIVERCLHRSCYIRVFNAITGKAVCNFASKSNPFVYKLLFNRTDSSILYALSNRNLECIQLNGETSKMSWCSKIKAVDKNVYKELISSNNGRYLAVSFAVDFVEIIDSTDGAKLARIAHVHDPPNKFHSADAGKHVHGVQLNEPSNESVTPIAIRSIPTISFSPKDTLLFTGDENGLVVIWPLQVLLNKAKNEETIFCNDPRINPVSVDAALSSSVSRRPIIFVQASPDEEYLECHADLKSMDFCELITGEPFLLNISFRFKSPK